MSALSFFSTSALGWPRPSTVKRPPSRAPPRSASPPPRRSAAARLLPMRPHTTQRSRCQARVTVRASANDYKERGRQYNPENITVKRSLGEGSFGQVFEGELADRGQVIRVVLKRVKPRVEGAREMMEMEHMLNAHVAVAAPSACAQFLGYMKVEAQATRGEITQGLWLLWEFRGDRTLAFYLRRRDGMRLLAEDLGVAPESAAATAMQQILGALRQLHAARVVHRDIKPLNIVLDEEEATFRIIDLGAAADLRTGMNYTPDESILDVNYCAPELYVLPTDTVDLSEQVLPVALAVSPMLWARHQPDRFDIYGAGLVLMQLAIPEIRSEVSLKSFGVALKRAGYDLEAWRTQSRLARGKIEVLDADDGAGWKLAAAMLRKRVLEGEEDEDGETSKKHPPRPSAAECLKHSFFKQANKVPIEEEADDWSNAFGVWRKISSKMFELEASIVSQTSATSKQTAAVKKLAVDVAEGKADAARLKEEEEKLGRMEKSLQQDVSRFDRMAQGASKWLSGFVGGRGAVRWTSEKQETGENAKDTEVAAAQGESDPLAAGARFGSLAVSLAGQMAARLQADAERRASRIDAEAIAREEEAARQREDEEEAARLRKEEDSRQREEERLLFAARLKRIKEAEEAEAALGREVAFRKMLAELLEPAITGASIWPVVKRRVWADPRFAAVAPECRERLFNEYIEVLQEYEEAMSLTNGGTQNPRGGASPAPVPVGHQAKPEGLIPKLDEKEIVMEASTVADESTNNTMLDLELLSETMQDEYQKLEERLAEMEQALLIRENLLRDAVQDGSLEAEEEQGETTLGQQSRAEKAMDGEPAGFFTSRRGMGVISNKNLNGSHLSGSGKMADRDSGYSP